MLNGLVKLFLLSGRQQLREWLEVARVGLEGAYGVPMDRLMVGTGAR